MKLVLFRSPGRLQTTQRLSFSVYIIMCWMWRENRHTGSSLCFLLFIRFGAGSGFCPDPAIIKAALSRSWFISCSLKGFSGMTSALSSRLMLYKMSIYLSQLQNPVEDFFSTTYGSSSGTDHNMWYFGQPCLSHSCVGCSDESFRASWCCGREDFFGGAQQAQRWLIQPYKLFFPFYLAKPQQGYYHHHSGRIYFLVQTIWGSLVQEENVVCLLELCPCSLFFAEEIINQIPRGVIPICVDLMAWFQRGEQSLEYFDGTVTIRIHLRIIGSLGTKIYQDVDDIPCCAIAEPKCLYMILFGFTGIVSFVSKTPLPSNNHLVKGQVFKWIIGALKCCEKAVHKRLDLLLWLGWSVTAM